MTAVSEALKQKDMERVSALDASPGLMLSEDEAYALLSLAILTPHRLDTRSIALLIRLAEHCKTYGPESSSAES